MCPICAHWPRVCSLKLGSTPLMIAVQYSESPAVVEALRNLVKAKANWEARNKVMHMEDNRCAPYVLIGHACVR